MLTRSTHALTETIRKREQWKLFIEILHNLLFDNNQGRPRDAASASKKDGAKRVFTCKQSFGM